MTASSFAASHGDRLRRCVALILRAHRDPELPAGATLADLRDAAVRVAMRLAVLLLAAARGRVAGAALDPARAADCSWAGVQALGRGLAGTVPLFAPGAAGTALAVLERDPGDAVTRALLALLRTWEAAPGTEGPADLAALPAEHIGVLYEAVLDLDLRQAPAGATERWVLARRAATRKGAGSFYTPPALAAATVARALRPLAYVVPDDGAGADLVVGSAWPPRAPDEILGLRVCDPAMGAGSFLLAALRFLGAALASALGRRGEATADAARSVAERCLYGVDLDPLAVDLASAALWLEAGATSTGLRVGNALVGGWIERAGRYPVMARTRSRSECPAPPAPPAPLREALDTWCALWFWPADRVPVASLPAALSAEARATVAALARAWRFFHWELEFPEVFARGGFDAVVGNPPWEIEKPLSREFFADHDAAFAGHARQAALRRRAEICRADPAVDRAWAAHCARYRALTRWIRHVAAPFGPATEAVPGEVPGADPPRPFRLQGAADVNTYKLFLEQSLALLRPGGVLGMLVPAGLYSDHGTAALRTHLLTRCRWRWLFGFENRRRIFAIDGRFKFCAVVVEKGGTTEVLRAASMRRDPEDWAQAERWALAVTRGQIEALSPRSRAVPELAHPRDLAVLTRVHAGAEPLGRSPGWGVRYGTDFHMTGDSARFPPRTEWEARGYRPDSYGRWIGPRGEVALPLYEGRMVGAFDHCQKGWVSGRGRAAVWRSPVAGGRPGCPGYTVRPQYLMAAGDAGALGTRVAIIDVASATNARTMYATVLARVPCGHSAPVLTARGGDLVAHLALAAVLNAFAFDAPLRLRLAGLHVTWNHLGEAPVPPAPAPAELLAALALPAARLALPAVQFAPEWLALARAAPALREAPWRRGWAVTPLARLRLRCQLDAVVASLYGLAWEDLAWILRDCDHPVARLRSPAARRALDPKGFWRVDAGVDPELRHSVLALAAFRDLLDAVVAHGGDRAAGIAAFSASNGGDGWMPPPTLRLCDLGLGHDARADAPQPVLARLTGAPQDPGPDPGGSWEECARHARAVLGAEP